MFFFFFNLPLRRTSLSVLDNVGSESQLEFTKLGFGQARLKESYLLHFFAVCHATRTSFILTSYGLLFALTFFLLLLMEIRFVFN